MALDEVFRLHYYSPVDNPSRLDPRLFNQDPVNLYQDEQALELIEKCLRLLT